MKKIILLGKVQVAFFGFKQLPLNTKQKFDFLYHLIDGEKLLSVVVGVLSFSTDKPLDFHDEIFLISPRPFKV